MTRPPATMPPSHPQNRAGAKVPPMEGVATESSSSGGAASVSTDETVACTPRVWPHLLLRFHAGLLLRSNSGQTSRSKNRPARSGAPLIGATVQQDAVRAGRPARSIGLAPEELHRRTCVRNPQRRLRRTGQPQPTAITPMGWLTRRLTVEL